MTRHKRVPKVRVAIKVVTAAALAATLVACGTDDDIDVPDVPSLGIDDPLSFEGFAGATSEASFEVANEGDDAVELEVAATPAWMEVEDAPGTIEGQSAVDVNVGVTCPDEGGALDGTVEIVGDGTSFTVEALLDCQPLDPGSLSVDVEGLPDGLDARIDVVGPAGFEAEVGASTTLDDLVPGEYRVYAFEVGDEAIYRPEPEEATVELEAGEEASLSVDYEMLLGGIEVAVEGLPDGAEPEIALIDPEGEEQMVADGDVIEDLEPGAYIVAPATFEDDDAIYQASSIDVDVVSGEVTLAEINYLVDSGSLEVEVLGLPDGVDHDIDVIDGDGEITSLPQSGELSALEEGDYDIVPNDVEEGLATYEADAQQVTIVSDTVTDATVVYEVIDGELPVEIEGLPAGWDADVTLEGPQTRTVTETTTFDDLEPGTYTVTANDVTVDGTTYEVTSAPTSVDVASGDNDGIEISYQLVSATLEVVIAGLDGIDGDVLVTGPDDFEETITETQSFDDVAPGEYTATAQPVSDGLADYEGDSASVTLESGDDDSLTVTYAVVPGELDVQVAGLPAGWDADVTLEGPETRTVTETTTFDDLEPGTYTVTANDVTVDGTTYEVASAPTSVDVASGDNDGIEISYQLVSATLEVVIAGLDGIDGDVLVTGPDDFEETITETTTFEDLAPGEYVVAANTVSDNGIDYTADGDTVELESDDSDTVTVSYEAVPGDVEVQISGLPAGVDADVLIEGPEDTLEPTETTNYTDLTPGTFTVTVEEVNDDGTIYEVVSAPETVELGSGDNDPIEIEYDVISTSLEVVIEGLEDLDADVVVTGPDDFEETITETTFFNELVPGEYVVTANDVSDGGIDYTADGDTVELDSDASETVTVSYEAVPGDVEVQISGLDDGVDADVLIEGPEDTLEPTETTSYTDLVPGTFEVTANDVTDGAATYAVTAPETVELGSGDNDAIEITYELVTGDINLTTRVYESLEFEVTLQGPDGFSEPLTEATSFSDVMPGEYELSVTDAPQDGEDNEPYVSFEEASFEVQSGDVVEQEIVVAPGRLVTRDGDEGVGTLRDRVAEVVADTTIEFSPNVPMVMVGDEPIVIAESLTIDGGGDATIDGQDDGRLLEIVDDVDVGLTGLVLTGGSTDEDGGALYIGGAAMVDIMGVTFEANFAEGGGGAVYVNDDGSAYIEETVFEGNSVDGGGAALAIGSTATDAMVQIHRSLIDTNQGGTGAALMSLGQGSLIVAQSTVVNNHSDANSAAISATGGNVEVMGATVVGNTGAPAVYSEASLSLTGSIVADNDEGDLDGADADFSDGGYNVIGVGAAGFEDGEEGNQVGSESAPLDPMLGDLADNGGPTWTKKPQAGDSPADGAIPASVCYDWIDDVGVLWSEDQRGENRPAGASCTAGAYEFDSSFESFDNADMSRSSYNDGSFEGDLGLTWVYEGVLRQSEEEGDDFVIDGESLMLDGNQDSRLYVDDVPGGVDSLSLQVSMAWTNSSPRQVEVLIDGDVVATSPDAMVDSDEFDAPYPVFTLEVDGLGVDGDFDLEIRPASGSRQVMVDNLSLR